MELWRTEFRQKSPACISESQRRGERLAQPQVTLASFFFFLCRPPPPSCHPYFSFIQVHGFLDGVFHSKVFSTFCLTCQPSLETLPQMHPGVCLSSLPVSHYSQVVKILSITISFCVFHCLMSLPLLILPL